MNKFFDYELTFDEDPQFLMDQILDKSKSYIKEEDSIKVKKAYEFAKKAHHGVKRLSGEPYIIHPVKATLFLMELKPDVQSIQACLLHDVIEDTPISYEDIKKEFGPEVAFLCE
ncbi:MAG: bifunctional (p)ppGpp synthetase/guanosine-3',5'-bis(diphosphate) 3'-pyrophosphohydrolase [bacterium]|nr:bifunctional (p)ppGpp synthetase/guanosine-3',5'-bis(diphosphate) 3'-pyrophosphohydrolase [bacterium]